MSRRRGVAARALSVATFCSSALHAQELPSAERGTQDWAPPATPAPTGPPPRGGFFQRTHLMVGGHFLTSRKNVVSGFELGQPSSSRGVGGGAEVEFGGGLGTRVALSGFLRLTSYTSLRARVEETSVALRGLSAQQAGFGAAVTYFFWQDWYATARAGFLIQTLSDGQLFDAATDPGFVGADTGGPMFGLAAGRDVRFVNQLWGGIELRVDGAGQGDSIGALHSWVMMPALGVHLTWL